MGEKSPWFCGTLHTEINMYCAEKFVANLKLNAITYERMLFIVVSVQDVRNLKYFQVIFPPVWFKPLSLFLSSIKEKQQI